MQRREVLAQLENALSLGTKGLLLLCLGLPGLLALLRWSLGFDDPQLVLGGFWGYFLGRLDSGFQLGLGSYLQRGLLLLLTGLLLVTGAKIPGSGRGLWLSSWYFLGAATLSACYCSHPFEGLLTVLDAALLLTVVLLAYRSKLREWLPNVICLSAVLVALVGLYKHLADPPVDGRLVGSFEQPNVTACYLAAALPWILNQWLGRPSHLTLKLLQGAAYLVVFMCLMLTATRAAWLMTVMSLTWRWWLGYRLKPGRSWGWPELGLACFPPLVMGTLFFLGLTVPWAFGLTILGLAALAGLDGLKASRASWALVLSLSLAAYIDYTRVHLFSTNAGQIHLQRRLKTLAVKAEQTDPSLESRREFWRSACLMGADHPWLGVGPRGFHRYYPSYQVDERWFSKYAHSALLSCWAELGLLGSLGAWLLLAFWLERLRRSPGSYVDEAEARQSLDASTSFLIVLLCAALDVHWQFPALPVLGAAWLGLSLREPEVTVPAEASSQGDSKPLGSLREPEVLPPAPAVEVNSHSDDQTVGVWTLRPRVVLSSFLLSFSAVLSVFNLSWAAAQVYSDWSEESLKRARAAEAIVLDRNSVVLNPFQASHYHHLGLAYATALALKSPAVDPKEYLRVAERAVALDGHRAVHYDLLAKAYLANGRSEEARRALRRALELDPVNYPSFYTSLAQLTPSEDKLAKERILLTCLQRFPVDALEAMFDFRSQDIQRQMTEVFLQLADLSNPSLHPQLALNYYDQLLKHQPKEPSGQLGRIVCLVNLNRLNLAHQEALALYQDLPRSEVLEVLKSIYYFQKASSKPLPPRK